MKTTGAFIFNIGSHVPSRLKGIETIASRRMGDGVLTSSHVPSRLKGIETLSAINSWLVLL